MFYPFAVIIFKDYYNGIYMKRKDNESDTDKGIARDIFRRYIVGLYMPDDERETKLRKLCRDNGISIANVANIYNSSINELVYLMKARKAEAGIEETIPNHVLVEIYQASRNGAKFVTREYLVSCGFNDSQLNGSLRKLKDAELLKGIAYKHYALTEPGIRRGEEIYNDWTKRGIEFYPKSLT